MNTNDPYRQVYPWSSLCFIKQTLNLQFSVSTLKAALFMQSLALSQGLLTSFKAAWVDWSIVPMTSFKSNPRWIVSIYFDESFSAPNDALRLNFVSYISSPLSNKTEGKKINQPAFDPSAASIHIKHRTSTRNRVIDSMSAQHASLLIGSTKIHFLRSSVSRVSGVGKWKVLTHSFVGFNRLQTLRPDRLKIDGNCSAPCMNRLETNFSAK